MMKYILLILTAGFTTLSFAQDLKDYQAGHFVDEVGDTLKYRILFPKNYSKDSIYPLVLFLHGAGERGNDNEAQLVHGADLFLKPENRKKYPAIVVFPQCKSFHYWAHIEQLNPLKPEFKFPFYEISTKPMRQVMGMMEKLVREERVDQDRLYLMGLSMGGFGTFELLARWPGRFATAVPICGGGNAALIPMYGNDTRIWIFHGAKDTVVPVINSRKMYARLKAFGADVQYTEYPDAQHDSWTPAFNEPGLLDWLFQ